LTTVSWSREDQGKTAAGLLLERIEGETRGVPAPPRRMVIPPRLVVRRSSRGK
jgi:DNA-binding LacI/PurR family transcriptional regulator